MEKNVKNDETKVNLDLNDEKDFEQQIKNILALDVNDKYDETTFEKLTKQIENYNKTLLAQYNNTDINDLEKNLQKQISKVPDCNANSNVINNKKETKLPLGMEVMIISNEINLELISLIEYLQKFKKADVIFNSNKENISYVDEKFSIYKEIEYLHLISFDNESKLEFTSKSSTEDKSRNYNKIISDKKSLLLVYDKLKVNNRSTYDSFIRFISSKTKTNKVIILFNNFKSKIEKSESVIISEADLFMNMLSLEILNSYTNSEKINLDNVDKLFDSNYNIIYNKEIINNITLLEHDEKSYKFKSKLLTINFGNTVINEINNIINFSSTKELISNLSLVGLFETKALYNLLAIQNFEIKPNQNYSNILTNNDNKETILSDKENKDIQLNIRKIEFQYKQYYRNLLNNFVVINQLRDKKNQSDYMFNTQSALLQSLVIKLDQEKYYNDFSLNLDFNGEHYNIRTQFDLECMFSNLSQMEFPHEDINTNNGLEEYFGEYGIQGKNGRGVIMTINNIYFTGIFSNDKKEGLFNIEYLDDNVSFIGHYTNDQRNGLGIIKYENDDIALFGRFYSESTLNKEVIETTNEMIYFCYCSIYDIKEKKQLFIGYYDIKNNSVLDSNENISNIFKQVKLNSSNANAIRKSIKEMFTCQ